jgi:hypothetical protein
VAGEGGCKSPLLVNGSHPLFMGLKKTEFKAHIIALIFLF